MLLKIINPQLFAMIANKHFLIVLFLISIFLSSCSKNELTLANNGKAKYEIVYSGDATESQYKSAEKLGTYLKEISGAAFDIVNESSQTTKKKIYVGNIKEEKLQPNEIHILTEDGNLFISGGSDTAIQNAIYEFLEQFLDCRWYAPGVEEIPSKPTIKLNPTDYSYNPDITTRTVHSRLFYENHEFANQLKVTYEAFPKYVPNARVHTFHRFMPEEVFYKSNPEYFALRDGKRYPTQLCLTNEKVLKIVKDSVASFFKSNPNSSVISVSQDDNQQYCQCDNCSKIHEEEDSPAGSIIRFVNTIAQAFPDKTISTLAYQYTRKPPKIKPVPNVLITLCSIECDRSAPIADKCTDFTKDLEGWGKLTNNIRVWDYTTQFTNFLAPFPNLRTLKPNIELFKNNNAKWIFEQHSNNPSDLFELRSYITAKLLWNPDNSLEELITEFTNGYYKKAGPYIKDYIDLLHNKLDENPDFFLFLYGDPSEAFVSYLSPALLDEYTLLFDKAEKAVKNNPEILNRVKTARLGLDFAILEASRKNLTPAYSLTSTNDDGKIVTTPNVAKLLDNFLRVTNENNITLMNEMGFTVTEYGANYYSTIETAKKPNKAKSKTVTSLTQPKKYAGEDPMVLTDGALGGSSFYSNWLGYEGNDMEVVVDLGQEFLISKISMAFLQVTNHIVFFPTEVQYLGSKDNSNFTPLQTIKNPHPLNKKSKVNDIQYFDANFAPKKVRYLKVRALNNPTPYWHHAAGLPSWVFADEILID